MNRKQLRQELIDAAGYLCRLGYVVADSGVLSARIGPEIYITPAGVHRARLEPKKLDVVRIDGKGKKDLPTDSEAWTHLMIYRDREDIAAVIHAQPPTATGFSVSGETIDPRILPELLVRLGGVPFIRRDPTRLGASDSSSVLEHLAESRAFLIGNRGVLTVGNSVWDAVARQELVEHAARVLITARILGKVETLSDAQVARLVEVHFEAGGGRNR